MTQLVHHAFDAVAGELSPFVQRIHDIAKGSELSIACPYLGLRVWDPETFNDTFSIVPPNHE